MPGKFVDKFSGETLQGKYFEGTVGDWYQGLVDLIFEIDPLGMRIELPIIVFGFLMLLSKSNNQNKDSFTLKNKLFIYDPENFSSVFQVGLNEIEILDVTMLFALVPR